MNNEGTNEVNEEVVFNVNMPRIIKRNGKVEDWNSSKIENAAYKALMTVGAKDADVVAEAIADSIEDTYQMMYDTCGTRTVDYSHIHNAVEYKLMDLNKQAAKHYIIYRKQHADANNGINTLMAAVAEISKEISKDNANIHNSPASKMYEIGSEANKAYVLNHVLPAEFANAHKRGLIHIHDLNYYQITYNCLTVPLKELLSKMFKMPHGYIRKPKRFMSACALTAVLIQSVQNDQFGGVAIDLIDTALAPFAKGLTDKEIYQGCEALIFNLCTLHSRAGNQVPFSSLSGGVDTDPDAKRVWHGILEAYEAGLGKGEQPIFPNLMTKVKAGINLNPEDPNYDILTHSLHVTSKRLNPTYINLDASFNAPYGLMASYMGCRTRVMTNVNGPEITDGRGNIAFVTANLPMIALDSVAVADDNPSFNPINSRVHEFKTQLQNTLELMERQLIHRWETIKTLRKKDIPFNFGGIYLDSEKLDDDDKIESSLKNGTLTFGFCGLAECLVALTGQHHGESAISQVIGIDIIKQMRNFADACTKKYHLNFSVIATPAEGTCDKFARANQKAFGKIEGVTDRDFVTNSFHVPVWYKIDVDEKFKIEAPYHALCNGGHISYSELDGAPIDNIEGLERILKEAFKVDMGYIGFNFPVDYCLGCGLLGVIPTDECPSCGCTEIKRIRRVSGYLSDESKINHGKLEEIHARTAHYGIGNSVADKKKLTTN